MVVFEKKIFMLGCGAVAQCTLPLLFKILNIKPQQLTIMDFVDNRARVKEFIERGVTYVHDQLTEQNYQTLLKKYLSRGDLFIDLAWNIETCCIIEWCHENDVLYLNSSVEEWEPYKNVESATPQSLTLYARQMELRELTKNWPAQSPTAIVDHGANPGLVSHFTKQALIEIAQKIIAEQKQSMRTQQLEDALNHKNFPVLAQLSGTKVIHISERDTQIINKPKEVNEFVNTWSIEGFMEEGMAPAELGWGTHEKQLPPGALTHQTGPQNQILLASRGMDTLVYSWVPAGPIIGMVIRHGEAFGISERLTMWHDGKAIYRPTVHYAYCTNDAAYCSLFELRMRNFVPHTNRRIINDEIIKGEDQVGCLLMGHDFTAWWIGSCLSIEETRRLTPHQNATTLQVAISIVAAARYAINNPRKGFCLPDDIDHEEILSIAKPYLGTFVSTPVDWSPLQNQNLYLNYGKKLPAPEDAWQFSTFLVKNNFYQN